MQYLLGLPKFTEKPVFVPELFVQIRKRLDHEFFNLLTLLLSEADGSELIDRLLDKFCACHKAEKPRTHRVEARQAFISLTKKKCKGKKLVDKVRLIQLRCRLADLLTFLDFLGGQGASIVNGYTYVDHLSWDAYNESSDLAMQLELYKKRFGMLPQEVQADKLYLGKANKNLIKTRRGPSARGTRWDHIRNLQKGLPGKRHQGET